MPMPHCVKNRSSWLNVKKASSIQPVKIPSHQLQEHWVTQANPEMVIQNKRFNEIYIYQ